MSNLRSAKESLAAELAHARHGMEFYNARVRALEETLEKIETLNSEVDAGEEYAGQEKAPRTRGRKAKEAAPEKKKGKTLPATGKEFWTGLITNQPRSTKEILEAAVEALGVHPSKDELKKLSQRQANALHMLVKEKVISDSGAGRERKFYRVT